MSPNFQLDSITCLSMLDVTYFLLKKHIKILGQDENRGLYLANVCAMKTIRANKDAFSRANTWKPEKDFLVAYRQNLFSLLQKK